MHELANSQDLPGGINSRPLVGGFAVAAYEAAKFYHYETKRMELDIAETPVDRPPLPSI